MGGPVGDPNKMLLAWMKFSYKLKVTLGTMVLPLGSLKIRMVALLFKFQKAQQTVEKLSMDKLVVIGGDDSNTF
ncbi:serine/threonine-protein kinase EDR1 isoform X1 [Tanacetum coccineum]|uniref:Serine/threonine-protein kinase EDR1 isoform X1 n=1 Tax=Tanacetum coccineum TaxID=301880 RepID=A0ABQ4ZEF3_9ASTR